LRASSAASAASPSSIQAAKSASSAESIEGGHRTEQSRGRARCCSAGAASGTSCGACAGLRGSLVGDERPRAPASGGGRVSEGVCERPKAPASGGACERGCLRAGATRLGRASAVRAAVRGLERSIGT
jgi:hypothetical protein